MNTTISHQELMPKANAVHHLEMDNIYDVRQRNLALLIEDRFGGNKAKLARALGFDSPSLIYRLLAKGSSRKQIGPSLARRIEVLCEKKENWLDNAGDVQERSENILWVQLCKECQQQKECEGAVQQDTIASSMPIATSWVSRHLPGLTSPDALCILTAYGDSMSPTYSDGDILFVDSGVKEIRFDGVFVFERDSEVYIKRIQRRMDGSIVVISDNPKYGPPQAVPKKSHLIVIGRVVYAWTGAKL